MQNEETEIKCVLYYKFFIVHLEHANEHGILIEIRNRNRNALKIWNWLLKLLDWRDTDDSKPILVSNSSLHETISCNSVASFNAQNNFSMNVICYTTTEYFLLAHTVRAPVCFTLARFI